MAACRIPKLSKRIYVYIFKIIDKQEEIFKLNEPPAKGLFYLAKRRGMVVPTDPPKTRSVNPTNKKWGA